LTDLSTRLGPLQLKNPLVAVSGTFGYGFDYGDLVPPDTFGAVVVKGTAPEPWSGNPPPRIRETPSGMLNAIGLENPGVDEVISEHLPVLAGSDTAVIVNVVGRTVKDYVTVAGKLGDVSGVDALEINISCPNVKTGGLAFGTSGDAVESLVKSVRRSCSLPLVVKLTPNVTDIGEIARAAERGGADALSLINTVLGMEIDVPHRKPVLGNVFGGLSGPAIRPVALRCIWQVHEVTDLPILGMGGVSSARDVVAFMLAGAAAVGIGTAIFSNPSLPGAVLCDLRKYYEREGRPPVGGAHLERGDET